MIDSASEQPALRSGISTVFSGFSSFAVSAMKCTPASTITDGVGARRLAGQRQAVADDVADRVEDVRRLVVVRQDDRVPLALQLEDRGDVVGQDRPFERRHVAFDPAVELGQRQAGDGLGGEGLKHVRLLLHLYSQ